MQARTASPHRARPGTSSGPGALPERVAGNAKHEQQADKVAELAGQLADLRLDLAKRDADVLYLEGELAQVCM